MLFADQFNSNEIDEAGRILAQVPAEGEDDSAWIEAFETVGSWRAAHAGPLRTFRSNLDRRVGRRGIVAQRLKRMPTIISKLERLPWLKLSRMQDIGGCRAIVLSAEDAFTVATGFANSRIRHIPIQYKNYIQEPRNSGYRGLHLVYSYNSERNLRWQGLKTEIQIRSRLQHQWATAVEIVGTFTSAELKSSLGDERWLRFFALMSSVISRHEGMPNVPNTPLDWNALVQEIRRLDQELEVSAQLALYQSLTGGLQNLQDLGNLWIGVELDLHENKIEFTPFRENDAESAGSWYVETELEFRNRPEIAVVLLSVKRVSQLGRAYPNFFADLTEFRRIVRDTIA